MAYTIVMPDNWQEHTEGYRDGDWDIRFLFDGYTVCIGGIVAGTPQKAIEWAESQLPRAIFEDELVEITAELMGVFK